MRANRLVVLCVVAALAASTAARTTVAACVKGFVKCKGVRDSGDAVVYIAEVPGKTFAPPAEHAKVDQLNLVFRPHVLPVLIGTTVDFLNSDAVLHNVFSPDDCAEKFNLGTWPKGQVRSFPFKKECTATLLCKVHPEMEAFVVAVPTPYFAVTKPDGSYLIGDAPEGSFTVKVWHPRLKGTERVVVVAGDTEASFEISR